MNELPVWKVITAANQRGLAVGAYWIGGVRIGIGFHLTRRPAWLHRFMMRYVFGWVWADE